MLAVTFIFLQKNREKYILQFSKWELCSTSLWTHHFLTGWRVQYLPHPLTHPYLHNDCWPVVTVFQGICFTWSLRDLDWWWSHHLLAVPSSKYNLITTVEKMALEGLGPGIKYCSPEVIHIPSSPGSLIRHYSRGRTATAGLQKNIVLQVLRKELCTSELLWMLHVSLDPSFS